MPGVSSGRGYLMDMAPFTGHYGFRSSKQEGLETTAGEAFVPPLRVFLESDAVIQLEQQPNDSGEKDTG